MSGPSRFSFVGSERDVATAGRFDWSRPEWPRLWTYNLHYFDDLAADGAAERADWHRALVRSWVVGNPPTHGTGWEPYPISLRIVNWVKWSLLGHSLDEAAVHSLAVQVRHLRRRLEIHLLGNHLWANAKALVFAGAFFEGTEAEGWLGRGLELVRRELAEQVLADGGHFERSPMYHATVLEDVLDLIQLGARYPGALPAADVVQWRQVAARMIRWLRVMSHTDGEIAFFNDSALDVAPRVAVLQAYAEPVGVVYDTAPLGALEVLPESGYVRLSSGPAVLIADVGAIGPDYIPGHAHADTLSFELSLNGRRVLVNSGTSSYEADVERVRQRGTAAHNAVVVDDADSSEVWSSFRVARRARPLDVSWGQDGDELWLRGAHDGYRRLPGRVTHRREWHLSPGGLRIVDRLEGQPRSARVCFHLHPTARPEDIGANLDGRLRTEPSTWHPRFGESVGNVVLIAELGDFGDSGGGRDLETVFRWPVVPG